MTHGMSTSRTDMARRRVDLPIPVSYYNDNMAILTAEGLTVPADDTITTAMSEGEIGAIEDAQGAKG